MDDEQYKVFLEEMNALEDFRMAYAVDHPSIPLERDDPDVKRLIEAMAFFNARTHMAGAKNITSLRLRLYQQFFPFLLSPLPAMGLVQITPTGQFTESVSIPTGSEIAISPESGGSAIFRTLSDLTIIPLSIYRTGMLMPVGRGYRWLLYLRTPYARSDEIGGLSFHINHLFDYLSSLKLLHALKHHMTGTAVIFDENVTETTHGAPCDISFGLMENKKTSNELFHPIEKERSFFHFPSQELFLNIHIPSTPRNWRQLTIIMDLDSKWPQNLRLNQNMFQLFTVPVENLKQEMSQPDIFDGTDDRMPIRHGDPTKGFELHSIQGVYKVEQNAMVPMKPGIISSKGGTYEIEQLKVENKRRHWLNLHFPEAFLHPRTICIDALWHQPWFSLAMPQRMKVIPFTLNVPGLKWEVLGEFVRCADVKMHEKMDMFLHLLAQSKVFMLNIDDLRSLLLATGAIEVGSFKQVFQLLKDVRVEEAPFQERKTGHLWKHVYHLRMSEFDRGIQPLVDTFVEHVEKILNVWISLTAIEVRLETDG